MFQTITHYIYCYICGKKFSYFNNFFFIIYKTIELVNCILNEFRDLLQYIYCFNVKEVPKNTRLEQL
jgi:hypothetical protein